MAKQIKATDIFESEDIFRGIRQSAEQAIDTLGKFKNELKQTADELKKTIGGATVGDTKSINELIAATQKANQVKEQTIKIDQEQERLRKLSIQAEREEIKLKKDQQAALDREAKAKERVARETAKQNSAYAQESAKLNELRKRYKDLAVQNKENTAEARNLLTQITALDGKLKQIDATVGQHQRNVGNYQQALGRLSGFLGQFGVAFGFGAAVQDSFKTIRDFDEANADMAKTLGISTEEAAKLSMEFTKLGSVTSIQGLQEIATIGGQFGISADQIGGFVSSMDKLNVALGGDFGSVEETAKQLGALRNIFTDIKTENIDQDLLGIGNALNELSSKGAKVEIVSDFANRISGLATPLGVTAGEILGLSATLAKLNVNAERGGTAVGTIFQRMTQDAAGFAKVAGVSTEEFTNLLNTDMVGAFKLVAKSFDGMKGDNVIMSKTLESLKLTGSGASEVFLKMASNTELLDANVKLSTESLKEQDSILQEVDKKSSTVGASVAKLGNAWDSFVLGINEGTGAQNGLITFFDFLAKNLPTIISIVGKLVAAWGIYKTVQLSLMAIDKARAFSFAEFGKNMMAQIPMTKQYAAAQQAAKVATKEAGDAAVTAGRSMNAVPWMAIIGVIIELGMAFYNMASGAERAREQAERLDNYKSRASDDSLKNITKETDELDKQLKQRDRELQLALAKAKTDKERNEIELKYAKLREQDVKQVKTQITQYRNSAAERLKQYRAEKKELESLQAIRYGNRTQQQQERIDQLQSSLGVSSFGSAAERMRDSYDILDAKIQAAGTRVTEYNKALSALDENLKDNKNEIDLTTIALNDNSESHSTNTKVISAKIPKQKELNTQMAEYNGYLTKQNELLAQLDQQRGTQQIENLSSEIGDLIDEANMLAEGGIVPDLTLVNQKLKEKFDLETKFIQDKLRAEIDAINARYDAESAKEKEKITENYNKLIGQDGLTKEQRAKIDADYKAQMEQFNMDELQRNADKELELKLLTENANYEQLQLEKQYGEQQVEIKESVNDKLTEAEKRRLEREKEEEEKKIELQKMSAEKRNEWAKFATDYFIEQSNKRIAQLDKEIAAAEKQQDTLRELAANGNINAKESLAENQRIIDEANRKKAQEERRKQMIELVSGVYQTYNQKVASGAENPLMETIRDTVLLQQFANTLLGNMPTFFDGTENTGTHGEGVDGKGGFHAILHPNERVVPKSLNEKIGSLSNEQLAKVAQEYQNGKLINGTQPMSAIDLSLLVNEMKDLKDVIRNKPETNIELGEITSSVMEIVKTTKQGNTLKTNRFRVRK